MPFYTDSIWCNIFYKHWLIIMLIMWLNFQIKAFKITTEKFLIINYIISHWFIYAMLLSFVGKHPYLCFVLSYSGDHCLIKKIVNEHMVTTKQMKDLIITYIQCIYYMRISLLMAWARYYLLLLKVNNEPSQAPSQMKTL